MAEIMDVSRWQGNIDWKKVKASGKIDGVMLRVLGSKGGKPYVDPAFERNYAACTARGIPVGGYYYTCAVTPRQTAEELAALRAALEGKTFQYPLAIDVESAGLRVLAPEALAARVAEAAAQLEAWNLYAMVYTYTNFADTALEHGSPRCLRSVDRGLPRHAPHPQARHVAVHQQGQDPRRERPGRPEPCLQGLRQYHPAQRAGTVERSMSMNSRELCTYVGVIGGAIAGLFGGWDTALQTLVIFMAVDYITGLIVAGVFHTSPKTKTGTLESRAGWKGLCRKGVSLLVVLVACRLDAIIGSSFIRDATVIAFACNETISIIENAGLMGVPIPAALTKAVDVLKQRAEKAERE